MIGGMRVTLEELKRKLEQLPKTGTMNKAKRAQIVAEINRRTAGDKKDEHSGKG